jgi:hypothetical protein
MKTVTITVTYEVWDGEGNRLVSTTDQDEAYKVRGEAHAAGKYAKIHTHREWACGDCGATVHASSRDTDCDKCGACYNVYGQRLNRNWRSNRSNYDEDCSDLDGYENALAGDS